VPARVVHDAALAHGAFAGRVLDFSTGQGVPGAQVTFAGDAGSQTVASDDKGQFAFEPPAAGAYTLAVVTAAGYLPFAPDWGTSAIALTARPGLRIDDVRVYLTPSIDYVGVVVDPDGAPVAGAEVRLVGAAAGEQALVPIADRYVSDARGEFVFHAHDEALLEARKAGFAPGRARLARGAQISHRLTIALGRAGTAAAGLGAQAITGRVLAPGGAPVKGAVVRAEPQGGRELQIDGEARAGDDGRFVLAGLDAIPYLVRATCPGCSTAEARVVAPGDVTLRLEPGGGIAGRVIDGGGGPVASFTVVVNRRRGPLLEETVQQATVIDAEGHFEVDGLAEGDYRVRATGYGHAASGPIDVHVKPGDDPADVLLQLPRGGTLIGRVVERGTGAPLELARLSVESSLGVGSSAVPLVLTTVTDARGEFTLEGLQPGVRSVTAAAYAHNLQMRTGLVIEEGGSLGPLVFELTPTKEGEEPTVELFGVGAMLGPDGDVLVVQQVIPGGGAALAGLVPGDAVLRIDGVPVAALGMDDSIQRIRGPEGSLVRLAVRRVADGSIADVPVKRLRVTF
jgi:hypothetical protein